MAREFSRKDRVGDQIQKELAQLIQKDVKDPRLGMVTVNEVKISKDFSYADVYVTVMNPANMDDSAKARESVAVLESASGFLRTELGRAIKLRVMPNLRFHYDESLNNAHRMESLIRRARAGDQASQGENLDQNSDLSLGDHGVE